MKIHVRCFLIVFCLCVATSVHAEEWMPDPALREAVRETLSLSGLKTASTKAWESLMSKTLHTQFLTTDS